MTFFSPSIFINKRNITISTIIHCLGISTVNIGIECMLSGRGC